MRHSFVWPPNSTEASIITFDNNSEFKYNYKGAIENCPGGEMLPARMKEQYLRIHGEICGKKRLS